MPEIKENFYNRISITYDDGWNFITFYIPDVNWRDHEATLTSDQLEVFIKRLKTIYKRMKRKI